MASSKSANTRKKEGLGCAFTAMVGLTSIVLLVVNGVALDAMIGDNFGTQEKRIIGPLQFIGSVVLIFFEYWIYDRVMARFRQPQNQDF